MAYTLIALLVVAATALALFLYRNSHAQRILRDRKRDRIRQDERRLK